MGGGGGAVRGGARDDGVGGVVWGADARGGVGDGEAAGGGRVPVGVVLCAGGVCDIVLRRGGGVVDVYSPGIGFPPGSRTHRKSF